MRIPIKFTVEEAAGKLFMAIAKLEGKKESLMAQMIFNRGILKWQEENPEWRERVATLQQHETNKMTA